MLQISRATTSGTVDNKFELPKCALARKITESPLACVESESGRINAGGIESWTRGGVRVCLTVFGRDNLCNAPDAGDADNSFSLWVSTAVPVLPVKRC